MKSDAGQLSTETASTSRADSDPVTESLPASSRVGHDAPAGERPTRTSPRPLGSGATSTSLADIPVVAQLRDPTRYRILGEHGRGGLGRVARATTSSWVATSRSRN